MDFQEKVTMLDNTFAGFLNGTYSNTAFEHGIGDVLSSMDLNNLEKTFEVHMVDNTKEDFYGFRLFPEISYLQDVTKAVIYDRISYQDFYEKWKGITKWVMEVDSKCFDRTLINFTPTELTALLLHEVGKTVYSDIIIERFYNSLIEMYIKLTYEEKLDMRIMYNLYMIPILKSCMLRDWVTNRNEINTELYSIHFIQASSREEEFATAVAKVIKVIGNDKMMDTTEKDKEITSSVSWANQMSKDFIKRKNKLKDDLIFGIKLTSSDYFRAVSLKILNDMGVGLRETYTGYTLECVLNVIDKEDFLTAYESQYFDLKKLGIIENMYAKEALFKPKQKDMKMPSQYDIDAIEVEVDRIASHHDRIYVLDLIYEKLAEIDDYEQYIAQFPDLQRRQQPTLDSMRKQLLQLRAMVLEKKNFDKTYKVFVKVPDGYEG